MMYDKGKHERLLDEEMGRACRSGDTELAENVLQRSEPGRENRYLMHGMNCAIMRKQIEVMKFLAERDAWVDRSGTSRQGCLAVRTNSLKVLDTLYDLGFRPNNMTIIYAVSYTDDDDVLRWLLDHGARPTNAHGLATVVAKNRIAAVEMLLEHGADPNGALYMAAQLPYCFEIMKFLVSKGADVNLGQGSSMGPPLTWAFSTANIKAAVWLMEQGATTTSTKFAKERYIAEERFYLGNHLQSIE